MPRAFLADYDDKGAVFLSCRYFGAVFYAE